MSNERIFTPEQETILKARLDGASALKKGKLSKEESESIKALFLTELDELDVKAEEQRKAEEKKRAKMNENRLGLMMPHDKENRFVPA